MEESKIKIVLDYGKILTRSKVIMLWCFLVIPIIMCLVTIGVVITITLGFMAWSYNIIIGLICANVMCGILAIILIYNLLYHYLLKKKILIWMSDSILVTALVVRMDTISINYLPKQVSINFEYDGQKYNILSTKRLFIQHRNYDFFKIC